MARPKAELPDPAAVRALADGEGRLALRVTPGAREETITLAEGKVFPRIPKLRASVFADYRFAPQWDASLGIRHSGRQYGSLDNSDHVDSYGAVSRFTTSGALTPERRSSRPCAP